MNRVTFSILIGLAGLWVLGGWIVPPEGIGGARLWSASAYRHLGGTVSVLIVLVAVLLVLVPGWQDRRAGDVSKVPSTPSRIRYALPLALAAAGILFWSLQSRYAFLGDNWLRVQQAAQGHSSEHDGGVLRFYHSIVLAASQLGWEAATAFRAVSVLCGLVSTAIWVRMLHDRGFDGTKAPPSTREVFLGTALFLLAGWTELFCGYIEVYPPLITGLLLWVWLSIRAMNGGRLLPAVILFLWIALAYLHRATWVWSPALVLALWVCLRGQRSFPARGFFGVTGLLALAGAGAAYLLSRESGLLLRWMPTDERPYAFFSWAHQIDIAQAVWLGTAAGLLLLIPGILKCFRAREISGVDAFLIWASVLPLVALSLFNPVLGAVDWDIWMLPLPFLLLFGIRQVRIGQLPRGPILALQLLVVGPWLLLHAGPTSIAWIRETVRTDRADYYQTHPSHLHLAFLFASNGLGAERRTELKAGLSAHPNDPRFPLNLAITSRADGDLMAAEDLAIEAYRRQRGYLPALIQLYEIYTEQKREEERDEIARTLLGAEQADPTATHRYVPPGRLRQIEQDLSGR